MFDLQQLEHAHGVVGAAMPPTPALAWPLLSERLGADVIVKHENHTPIGAFKVRGGLVYLDRLKREQPDTIGIISATRGNHGQSLAFAASRYRMPVTIYVPRAIRSRRIARCGRSAPTSSSTARIFRPRARKPIAAPRPPDFTSCRRSTAIWCSASRPTRSNCCGRRRISTCSTCRSGRARASAAASWRATCSGSEPKSSACNRPKRRPMRCPLRPARS